MKTKKNRPGGNLSGSKTVQRLRTQYYFLSLLQHPFRWLFWAIQQRLDRVEIEILRLKSHDQGRTDGFDLPVVRQSHPLLRFCRLLLKDGGAR
jgi:hypothetical protein